MENETQDQTLDTKETTKKSSEERLSELENTVKSLKEKKEKDKELTQKLANEGAIQMQRTEMSHEKKMLTFFKAKNVADLVTKNTASEDFLHVPMEYKQSLLTLKQNIDVARYMEQIFGGANPDTTNKASRVDFNTTSFGREVMDQIKAFGTGVSGGGQEWIPTIISQNAIEEYELERVIARQMNQLDMPSSPFELPVQNAVTEARISDENTAATSTSFGTAKIQFNAVKFEEHYVIPEELNEDSAVDFLRMARMEVIKAQDRAYEQAILNGDDSGTHMDNDTDGGAADLAAKALKGIRKLAIDNSATVDFGGLAPTDAKFVEMLQLAGKFGVNVRELMWIMAPKTYFQTTGIEQVTTVEKYGPMATILQGALAAYRGAPIHVSEYARTDVAATGVNTVGGPNTLAVCHLVNKSRFYWAKRRPIVVRAQLDLPNQDRWLLASYSRVDFKGHAQSASEASTILGINVG